MTFHLHSMYISPKYRLEVSVSGKISREDCAGFSMESELEDPIVIEGDDLEELREMLGEVAIYLRRQRKDGKRKDSDIFGRTVCLSGQDRGAWADMCSN